VLGRLHGNVSLIGKLEFLSFPDLVNILILLLFFVLLAVGVANRLRRDLDDQSLEVLKQLV